MNRKRKRKYYYPATPAKQVIKNSFSNTSSKTAQSSNSEALQYQRANTNKNTPTNAENYTSRPSQQANQAEFSDAIDQSSSSVALQREEIVFSATDKDTKINSDSDMSISSDQDEDKETDLLSENQCSTSPRKSSTEREKRRRNMKKQNRQIKRFIAAIIKSYSKSNKIEKHFEANQIKKFGKIVLTETQLKEEAEQHKNAIKENSENTRETMSVMDIINSI